MARGRFISKEICFDKTVNELSSAESKLGFTWLIPHLDKEGRTYGDPALVRSMVFPRSTDITVEQMEAFIQEWHDAGLIVWYECKGDRYILFPNFDKHQVGLQKDREADSVIPLPDELMTNSGVTLDQFPVKVKVKVSSKDKVSKGEVEVCDNDNQNALAITFHELTHKKAKPEQFTELARAGATPDDMRTAYGELVEKNYIVSKPSGILEPTMHVLGRKNGRKKVTDKTDYRSYLDS